MFAEMRLDIGVRLVMGWGVGGGGLDIGVGANAVTVSPNVMTRYNLQLNKHNKTKNK